MSSRLRGLDLGVSGSGTGTLSCRLASQVSTFQARAGPKTCRRSTSNDASHEATSAKNGLSPHKGETHKHHVDAANKTISTASGTLPLSPFMDPSFYDARERYKRAKKPESSAQAKTKFRRLLERNPYGMPLYCATLLLEIILIPLQAQALATPARRCGATEVVLPRYFLQDFNLVSHPETGRPWWISPSLSPDQQRETAADQTPGPEEDNQALSKDSGTRERLPGRTKPAGRTGYALSRQDLLKQFLVGSRSPYTRANEGRLLRLSERDRNLAKKAVWREDMDEFLLDLMRRRAVEDLLYLSELCEREDRKYLIQCETWEDIKRHDHCGCVLWLGGRDPPVLENEPPDPHVPQNQPSDLPVPEDEPSDPPVRSGPGRFATMDMEGGRYPSKIAVHNLRELLGDEHLNHLREGSAILRGGELFVLRRRRTIELQLKLWKLQGYIVEFWGGSTSKAHPAATDKTRISISNSPKPTVETG